MKNFIKSIFRWFVDDADEVCNGFRVGIDPLVHRFPNIRPDTAITIRCTVSPSASAYRKNLPFNEKKDSGIPGIRSQRVGAMVVEVDEYGLYLRWEPHEITQDTFTSPFGQGHVLPPIFKKRPNSGG